MQSSRDDDFLDFIFSHHTKEERPARCFLAWQRYFCARCSGWIVGTVIGLAIFTTLPFFYLLPLPAFIDWGARRLNFFDSGKTVGFITGIPLGLSYPSYFYELLNFDSYASISALFYIAVFAGIHIIGNLKVPSA